MLSFGLVFGFVTPNGERTCSESQEGGFCLLGNEATLQVREARLGDAKEGP